MPKRITVTNESNSGRNERFHDNFTGANMTRNQFVREINQGNYKNYHVRNINGIPPLFLIPIVHETIISVNHRQARIQLYIRLFQLHLCQ